MSRKAEANGDKTAASRKVLENIKEVTGASEEDICAMLQLCNGDVNEATTKLLESTSFATCSGTAWHGYDSLWPLQIHLPFT
jgi:hypothetical protein